MTTSDINSPVIQPEVAPSTTAAKQAQAAHLRKSIAMAGRVQVMGDGSRRFVRFNQVEILEHWLLLVSFAALGLTGLLQRFASLSPVAWIVNNAFGGIAALRTVHQVAAIAFGVLCLFHFVRILTIWFVKREPGSMLPHRTDTSDLTQMLQYNLGSAPEPPRFDRYTIDEKLGYWALFIAAPVMILTGLILWFPTFFTQFLPVSITLLARGIHSTTAIVAVLAVLTWHLYFTVFRERNSSIFTGVISEQAMKKNHPLEYQRILDAYEEVQNLSKDV
jgi:formate dehydrogenase subunit gamma